MMKKQIEQLVTRGSLSIFQIGDQARNIPHGLWKQNNGATLLQVAMQVNPLWLPGYTTGIATTPCCLSPVYTIQPVVKPVVKRV